ncbi:patatin-like phospholipase family protein [Pseudoflavonifractor phocaeensis]|uniref:patatin-like phospholipase family protein n=1 Tax=Pseudoflavonifractor phocaeensis TaxID=1870988 RepID=UPI001F35E71D|nr:patatin family protein [Pseudoflavonifractor phocaeensis]MCF2596703.1 patatin family protein [Pseudoflavonifractor phocaeensis]
MKIGVVDVGGGLRGVYAAGVFDYCLDNRVQFDLCIGVSAGSANISAYIAGQNKRNYPFYTDYPFRKEYMSLHNFIFKHSYLDLDYVCETLSNSDGENPLDYQAIIHSPIELRIVASNAQTGEVRYFDKTNMKQDDYSILKASSAIPFVCHPLNRRHSRRRFQSMKEIQICCKEPENVKAFGNWNSKQGKRSQK